MNNRLIPEIIPEIIPTINPPTEDGVAASGGTLHVGRTILLKEIVTDAARSDALVFKDHTVVNWKDMDGTIPQDRNTVGTPSQID